MRNYKFKLNQEVYIMNDPGSIEGDYQKCIVKKKKDNRR